ncbi:MAG: phosphate acyltransferase PlsX [Pseudomonadota bacterium]
MTAARVKLALDAMGGDHGPETVIPGAALALERHPEISFLLFGDPERIRLLLEKYPRLATVSEVRASEIFISMDEKPGQALRRGRGKSSMWQAIQAVKDGEADAAVSAGNTGALMAMATFCLRTMAGVDRPAIAAIWPTIRGESIVLDVGATIGADSRHLVTMSLMGSAMASILFDLDTPTVGLLNIGTEDVKGLDEIREAGRVMRELPIPSFRYDGFVEGDDIGQGTVDVVVTEGFSGNIALKTAEGTAKQIATYLRQAMGSSLMSRIGYLFARSAFAALKDRLDPRKVNGGVFLGLDGVVIKSHGGTDGVGFAAAIDVGYDMVKYQLQDRIRSSLQASLASLEAADHKQAASVATDQGAAS